MVEMVFCVTALLINISCLGFEGFLVSIKALSLHVFLMW